MSVTSEMSTRINGILGILGILATIIGAIVWLIQPINTKIDNLEKSLIEKIERVDKFAQNQKKSTQRMLERHEKNGHPAISRQIAQINGRFDQFDAKLAGIENLIRHQLGALSRTTEENRARIRKIELDESANKIR